MHYRRTTGISKYNSKKTKVGNYEFASKKEALRYVYLKDLLDRGQITHLEIQPKYVLLEAFVTNEKKKIRAMHYIADFAYINEQGQSIVEDVKGFETPDFKLKKKFFLWRYKDTHKLEIIK
jgi:hypothetical protein